MSVEMLGSLNHDVKENDVVQKPTVSTGKQSDPHKIEFSMGLEPVHNRDNEEKEDETVQKVKVYLSKYMNDKAVSAAHTGNMITPATDYFAITALIDLFKSNWFLAKDVLLSKLNVEDSSDPLLAKKARALMVGFHVLRQLDMEDTYKVALAAIKQKQSEVKQDPNSNLNETQIETAKSVLPALHKLKIKAHENSRPEPTSQEIPSIETPSSEVKEVTPQKKLTEESVIKKMQLMKKINDLKKVLREKKNATLLSASAAGSSTITSDIDSNPKGAYSVLIVKKFNEVFKKPLPDKRAAWPFEAGTVYDINVYGQDFIGGAVFQQKGAPYSVQKQKKAVDIADSDSKDAEPQTSENWQMEPFQEVELDEKHFETFADDQEVLSYVHILRYIDEGQALDHEVVNSKKPHNKEWIQYKTRLLSNNSLKGEAHDHLVKNVEAAETLYKGFRKKLLDKKVETEQDKGLQANIKKTGYAKEHKEDGHYADKIVEMTAANRIYEEQEKEVELLSIHLSGS